MIAIRPVRRSLTGWLAPRWPNGSLNVSRPAARESSWWPRQMPNTGLVVEQRADVVDDVVQRRGVAGAGDEEEAVGVARQQLLGGASCTGRISSVAPREVKLRMIERLMPVSSATIRGPVAVARVDARRGDRHLAGEVAADHARLGVDALARLVRRHVGGEDPAAHRARRADVADERARVDAR